MRAVCGCGSASSTHSKHVTCVHMHVHVVRAAQPTGEGAAPALEAAVLQGLCHACMVHMSTLECLLCAAVAAPALRTQKCDICGARSGAPAGQAAAPVVTAAQR